MRPKYDADAARALFDGTNWVEVCTRLGEPWVDGRGNVNRNVEHVRKKLLAEMRERPAPPNFPPSPVDPFEMHVFRTDEPVGDVGDLHTPSHDAAFLARMAARCHAEAVDLFVWAGDGIDAGQMHRRAMTEYQPRLLDDDLDLQERILSEMARFVRRQVYVQGNHERFLRHRTGGYLTEGGILRRWFASLGDRLTIVPHEVARIEQCGVPWTIVHGTSAAQNLMLPMERYAMRYRTNIIMHHVHQTMLAERWGYTLVCVGGANDSLRLAYQHEAPRPLPPTTQSFVILRGGQPTLYRASDPSW